MGYSQDKHETHSGPASLCVEALARPGRRVWLPEGLLFSEAVDRVFGPKASGSLTSERAGFRERVFSELWTTHVGVPPLDSQAPALTRGSASYCGFQAYLGSTYLPELPARGPGVDLVGRTAALLIDMPVETTPGGWRIAERPGRYMRAPAQHDVGRPRRDRGGLRRLRGAAQDKPVRATRSLTWGHLIGGPERSGAAGGVTGYGVSSWAVPPSIRL